MLSMGAVIEKLAIGNYIDCRAQHNKNIDICNEHNALYLRVPIYHFTRAIYHLHFHTPQEQSKQRIL